VNAELDLMHFDVDVDEVSERQKTSDVEAEHAFQVSKWPPAKAAAQLALPTRSIKSP